MLLIVLVINLSLSLTVRALSPPPDGGLPELNHSRREGAPLSLTTGIWNTALGAYTLSDDTDGSYNTAVGTGALLLNVGDQNAQTGLANTAVGAAALIFNTGGTYNTTSGAVALESNTTGYDNTAVGKSALFSNTAGFDETAIGSEALENETTVNGLTDYGNTAIGFSALNSDSTGGVNTAIGKSAGSAHTTGDGNIYLGANVAGVSNESNTSYIGNVYASVASGRAVDVDSDNRIGTLSSTRRVKDNIKPMDKASEAILALKPVTFQYKKEVDASGAPQFGLVAEEVAETDRDLVIRDKEGKPQTVRYEAVNAMLLNEFLKARREIDAQQKQIDALTAGLQKVSAQLQLSQPAAQAVVNNQ